MADSLATMRWTWPRRRLLGWAAAGGAVTVAGGLAACARGAGSPVPTATAASTVLNVAIGFQGTGSYQGIIKQVVDQYIAQHWLPGHPGVAVKTLAGSGSNGTNTGASTIVTNSLAGQPTDVVTGCCTDIETYQAAQLLMPLDTFIKQDNIDTSVFSAGHLQALQRDQAQVALPQYDGPEILIYNEAVLDDLGLDYPAPGWTYQDAYQMWAAATVKQKSKGRVGVGLDLGDFNWLVHAWGGQEMDASRTVATFNTAACAGAFTWMRDAQVAGIVGSGGSASDIQAGTYAMGVNGGWTVQDAAVNLRSAKWNYAPMPKFPGGASTFINNDFYAINQYTKADPSLVWDIFKFIVLDDGFQQLLYQTTFITPNRSNLWDTWAQVVQSVAPPLAGKHLEYYADAMAYGWPNAFFRYEADQAQTLKSNWIGQIYAQKIDAPTALSQLTSQINALESAAAASAATASGAKTLQSQFPSKGPVIGLVPTGL